MEALPHKEDAVGEKQKRGFAIMTPERRKEISQQGGASVRREKRTFAKNPKLATEAGRKGGKSVPKEKRHLFKNRAFAAELGRRGGIATRKKRRGE